MLTIVAFFASLLLSGSAVGQSPNPGSAGQWHLSYEMFQMLLEQRGLSIAESLESSLAQPAGSVVILLGDQSHVSRDQWRQLRRFVDQGGCLLVATEQNLVLPGVCSFFAGPVRTTSSSDRYQNFPDCLQLRTINGEHPLTEGVASVVVNRSGWISKPTDESMHWEDIVSLPDDCSPKSARGRAVVVAGLHPEPDRGVMILAADKSLLSNGMLWHGDNAILAIRISDLLCRGNRTRLTVIAEGRSQPAYAQSPELQPPGIPPQIPPGMPAVPEVPEPELATALRVANEVVDEVQKSDLLNEILRNRPRHMRPLAWLRTVLLVLALLATAFVLWKVVRNSSFLYPLRQRQFMQSMYGVQSARQIAASEFGTAVEILSRDLCKEISGSSVETDWIRMLSGGSAVSAALSRSLRKGLAEVLGIATKGSRVHISRRKFQALGRVIQELRSHHRSGRMLMSRNADDIHRPASVAATTVQ